ncbi:MAG TPA: ATP phosphoribosyltransferase regulatory subunit [Rhodocyclaceae bacterium]|nr:ATP phosphoribosyltransferase regulatory subunit [Rhodocyclaceae bacterium]
MPRWLLPEAIEDILPDDAAALETLRGRLLERFRTHGYQLVIPPLLEYVESLFKGSGRDMDVRTLRLVDPISGRMMGLRADITPQVARIDAHLLNRAGVARLCYCASVAHALPADFNSTREPIQIGAELYGHAGIEADREIIALLADSLQTVGVAIARIDLGHVGIFRALADAARICAETSEDIFHALQGKDGPTLRTLVRDIDEPCRSAFIAMLDCYGGPEVLERARARLPELPGITAALNDLARIAGTLTKHAIGIDLADLRGYHYHTGVVFAAYVAGQAQAIALGGRYDDIGRLFGRPRPATGFSLDLRTLIRIVPLAPRRGAIIAPRKDEYACVPNLDQVIEQLRAHGEIVIRPLSGEEIRVEEIGGDRRLVVRDGAWRVEP